MSQFLSARVYETTRPTRQEARFTIIEDAPQSNLPSYATRTKLTIPSSNNAPLLASGGPNFTPASDQTSDASSMWSHRSSSSSYDSLYDVTDDEFEEVPIKLSASVKRQAARTSKGRSRYPSLIIPSPTSWPTIQKLQRAQSPCTVGLSPAMPISITPAALATFNARHSQSPVTSSAPSLDGSLTSEEASQQSCPSTPDLEVVSATEQSWDQPMQLDPYAFEILHQLQSSSDDGKDDFTDPIITVSDEAIQEMQEIVKDTPVRPDFVIPSRESLIHDTGEEVVSALSIPSPGGFFSSLAPCAAQTWSRRTPEPSTGVAEDFYGVPWRSHNSPDVPPVPSLHLTIPQNRSSSPTAALDLVLSPSESSAVTELTERYNEAYEQALHQIGLENSDRTKLWLQAQAAYLSRIFQDASDRPESSEQTFSPTADASSPSKKSVRFVDGLDAIVAEIKKDAVDNNVDILNDPVFYHAFQHISKMMRKRDAFIHRQTRAEAVHVQRSNLTKAHCQQLLGHYQISTPVRPSPMRPISNMLPATPNDDTHKLLIATAERERQALDQIRQSAWALQAERQLQGGKLLNSPVERQLHSLNDARILDYGGQAAGDWGWQCALDYRNATVYTLPVPVVSSASSDMANDSAPSTPKGPSNHRVVVSANPTKPWSLPFPSAYFDVVSARTLHTFLKSAIAPESPLSPHPDTSTATTTPAGCGSESKAPKEDEYDLALSEIHRVLKPGGYLEYTIYDSTLLCPAGPLGLALSVEFAFNLRTRGYDPQPCCSFLPRLRRAGFGMVRRGWFVLPLADVRPKWKDEGKTSLAGISTEERFAKRLTAVEKSIGPDGEVQTYAPPLTGSTKDVQAITGLVGTRAWEGWMLHLGSEMGKSAELTMGDISKVLEEGSGEGKKSGWKSLKGWARKG